MAISKDLFLAILSMDVYNRGYGAGINFGTNSDAPNVTRIGNATIIDRNGGSEAASAGFYALAYDTSGVSGFSAGEKTIAYRGTDSLIPGLVIGSDIWNGYGVGTGVPSGKQAELAIKFYQSLATSLGASAQAANISVTGHSSGGGLAGLVGGLYGKYGALFDNMAFEQAATAAYQIANYSPLSPLYNGALKALIYGNSDPWTPSFSRLLTTYTEGEFLQFNRSGQTTPQVRLDLGTTSPDLGIFDRHSISLEIILKYATDAGLDASWKAASKYFAPALFNDSIGLRAGAQAYQGTSSLSS